MFSKKFRAFNSNKAGSRCTTSTSHNRHTRAVIITGNEETLNQCQCSLRTSVDGAPAVLKIPVNVHMISGRALCMNDS